ncbi:MAG: tyrosine recombinase XerC [Methylacidiphilales bacterium]|nr:tyrosine recombinase XerC [Candidatus Methylacidiphilales bacterium]
MPILISKAIKNYLQHLEFDRCYSKHTVLNYGYDLAQFLEYAGSQKVSEMSEITEALVEMWLASRFELGAQPRTVKRSLASMRGLVNYHSALQNGKPVRWDIRGPKVRQTLPNTLSIEEVSAVIEASKSLSLREHAIIELMYGSGLRVSEVVSLKIQDLDFEQSLVRVHGKRNKERLVPIGKLSKEVLCRYLAMRPESKRIGSSPVFLSKFEKALTTRAVQYHIKSLTALTGIPRLHPHLFRHCCASHLLESSGELRMVQELLGHESIVTTQIYTHLDYQHLAKVYDKTHPRSNIKLNN